MADRFHIIITGENGHSSSFQISRRKTLLIATAFISFLITPLALTLGSGPLFTSSDLSQVVTELQTELSQKEEAAALYQKQIARLEQSRQTQIESLKKGLIYQ